MAYLTIPGLWIFYGSLWILFIAYIIKATARRPCLSGTMVQVHQELEDWHGAWRKLAANALVCRTALDQTRHALRPISLYSSLSVILVRRFYCTDMARGARIVLLQFWAEKRRGCQCVGLSFASVNVFSAIQRVFLIEKNGRR